MWNKLVIMNWIQTIVKSGSKSDKEQKTIAVDFDGVLHSNIGGWDGAMPKNDPNNGSKAFIDKLLKRGYEVVIFSARARLKSGREGIRSWLEEHDFPKLQVTSEKPHAVLYIDDRGFRFNGDFDQALKFIDGDKIDPWYK